MENHHVGNNADLSNDRKPELAETKAKRRLSQAALERRMQAEQKRKERELALKQKAAEKLRLLEEKRRLIEEKRRRMAEERQRREEEKRQKQEERRQKEEEKKKREEEERQKREEERLKKEEERRKREEEKQKREEERLKKEEERQRLQAEKERLEEEKRMKEERYRLRFSNFFIRGPKVNEEKHEKQEETWFKPFEVKKDMFLAPIRRCDPLSAERLRTFEAAVAEQSYHRDSLYLAELNKGSTKPKSTGPTIVLDDSISVWRDTKPMRVKMKLLQFHENYRPAYFGTWRKWSSVITSRRPFSQDRNLLNYEVDSEEEWEEESVGDECRSDEETGGSSEEDDESESEDSKFFVEPGYLSLSEEDPDVEDESALDPETRRERMKARAAAWKAEKLNKKWEKLKPLVTNNLSTSSTDAAERLLDFAAINVEPLPISLTVEEPSVSSSGTQNSKSATQLRNLVPEEAMPSLIRLVHGSAVGIEKLTTEFLEYWKLQQALDTNRDAKAPDSSPVVVSRRQICFKIRNIAVREKRNDRPKTCWYVLKEVLQKYDLEHLSPDNDWPFVSVNVKNGSVSGKEPPQQPTPLPNATSPKTAKSKEAKRPSDGVYTIDNFLLPSKAKQPKVANNGDVQIIEIH